MSPSLNSVKTKGHFGKLTKTCQSNMEIKYFEGFLVPFHLDGVFPCLVELEAAVQRRHQVGFHESLLLGVLLRKVENIPELKYESVLGWQLNFLAW